MKIVIASRIFSPEPAAASFILEAITNAFVSHGDEVEVVTTKFPQGFSELAPKGYEISRSRVIRDSNGYVRGYIPYMSFDIPLFFRLLFRKKPDLYFIEPPPTSGAVIRLLSSIKRVPYFYDAADIWSDAAVLSTSNQLVLSLLRRMELFALRGAQRIFTISDGVCQRLTALGVDRPITVSGFGVDSDAFRFVPIEEQPRKYFVYAGTFSELHGASIFLKAFSSFTKLYPEVTLKFVGNGTEGPELAHLAHQLQLKNVEIVNPVAPEELNIILNGAIASLASLKPNTGYEYAFTTKVYASLASGCPVLFSGEGPTRPFIESISETLKAGFSVDYDAEQVSKAMLALFQNSLNENEREELSEWSRKHFSLVAVADAIVKKIHAEMTEQ